MSWLAERTALVARRDGLALQASASSPMPYIPGPTYEGAARGRRVAGFWAPRLGVNAALVGSAETMRARSHALMRTDPFTWRGLRAYVASLIGTGITPQPQVDDDNLAEAISELWEDWTLEADADGRTWFEGIQASLAFAYLLGGEGLMRLRARLLTDNLTVPLQLQVLEADHLPIDRTETLANGNMLRCGIEFGPIGNRLAYWLYPEHPNDQIGLGTTVNEPVRVPAFTTEGWPNVLHVYEAIRPGQLRGEPRMARVLLTAYHLDQYDDATLEKAKFAATITGFIRQGLGDTPALVDANNKTPDAQGTIEQAIEAGIFPLLKEGEDVTYAPAADIGDYSQFIEAQLRRLASGIGSTYEHTSGNYAGVTYSSLREAKNQLRRECEQAIFATLAPQFCQPVYERWFRTAVATGKLPLGAREFARNPRRFMRVMWVAPRMDYVDPLKEVEADKVAVRCGFKSTSQVIRERGENPRRVYKEIASERKIWTALGITLESDPAIDMTPVSDAAREDEAPAPPKRKAA